MTESQNRHWSEWLDPRMREVAVTKFFRFHLHLEWWIPERYSWPQNQRHVLCLIWWFPLPEKGEISFLERSWIWQPRLSLEERFRLQSAYSSSNIDDRSPACIISFLQVVRKAWCQCPGVLRAQPLSRFLLSLAWCRVVDLLVDFHPNPTHTLRLKDLGGAPPYWLGAAQLKAGGSCPMRCDDLSHCRKLPLASRSAPIEQET